MKGATAENDTRLEDKVLYMDIATGKVLKNYFKKRVGKQTVLCHIYGNLENVNDNN